MLQKGIRYKNELNQNVDLIDYVFYVGTDEHSFQLNINGKIQKEIIKTKNLPLFLNKFITVEKIKFMEENVTKPNSWKEMQEIIFASMREVKEGTLDVQKGLVIAKLGDTLVNSTKVEILSRMNKVYPNILQ